MKRCPNCNLSYTDENIFCLSDGTRLIFDSSDVPTLVNPSLLSQPTIQSKRKGTSPLIIYLAIGILALIAGGVGVTYLKSDSTAPANAPTQPKPDASEEPTSNRKVEVVQYPDSKPQPLTAAAIRNLILVWKQAQERKNFATYQACYDPSFTGVKTISNGSQQTFNYAGWMNNRRQMVSNAVNLNLDISNLQIRVEGDTAVAEFDQYYRSLRYSDWGPKELHFRMTPSGAKIVYEILKASYPL